MSIKISDYAGWLRRLVRPLVIVISIIRRPQRPALYEIWGSPDARLKGVKELRAAISTLGKTSHCITILCGDGVAHVVDSSDPMRRTIIVECDIRPSFGKVGACRELAKLFEETKLHNQRLSVRVVKNLTKLVRCISDWFHGVAKWPNVES